MRKYIKHLMHTTTRKEYPSIAGRAKKFGVPIFINQIVKRTLII